MSLRTYVTKSIALAYTLSNTKQYTSHKAIKPRWQVTIALVQIILQSSQEVAIEENDYMDLFISE